MNCWLERHDHHSPTEEGVRRNRIDHAAAGIMEDVDVLVLPTMKTPAQALGYEMTEMGEMELSLSRPFNLTGSPALAICNGFTATGLPISMQIVGRKFEDDTVLRAGHSVEQALGLRSRRPVLATENPG
ncbi:amidase family protein [Mesorhizobium sp. L2C067A000]|uniref:amidase family protein n=1 Tax=Mesorhizobium sp. L2C067A000 TaxID=1287106 RepID=UPI0018CB4CD5|nr:amidase family protein [Mesorhizobium sp. L2C067A000]